MFLRIDAVEVEVCLQCDSQWSSSMQNAPKTDRKLFSDSPLFPSTRHLRGVPHALVRSRVEEVPPLLGLGPNAHPAFGQLDVWLGARRLQLNREVLLLLLLLHISLRARGLWRW